MLPTASELPHVLLWTKSPELAPPNVMLVMLNEALPVFVTVTICAVLMVCKGWLPKVRLEGEGLITGPELMPVPVSAAGAGAAPELNVTLIMPERVPDPPGVNVTLMLQDAPAARLEQLFACE